MNHFDFTPCDCALLACGPLESVDIVVMRLQVGIGARNSVPRHDIRPRTTK